MFPQLFLWPSPSSSIWWFFFIRVNKISKQLALFEQDYQWQVITQLACEPGINSKAVQSCMTLDWKLAITRKILHARIPKWQWRNKVYKLWKWNKFEIHVYLIVCLGINFKWFYQQYIFLIHVHMFYTYNPPPPKKIVLLTFRDDILTRLWIISTLTRKSSSQILNLSWINASTVVFLKIQNCLFQADRWENPFVRPNPTFKLVTFGTCFISV